MIIFRARTLFFLGLWAVLASPAYAQMPMPADSGRDASFLPPPVAIQAPSAIVTPAPPATAAPIVITAPVPAAVLAPVATSSAAPALVAPPTATSPAVAPQAAAIPTPPTPASIAKMVEAAALGNIDPESIGLLSNAEGGLGADMWKGTSRTLIAKLFMAISLPTASKTLNSLAHRLLLTVASVPEGTTDSNQSLVSMRIEKLLALGMTEDAWKLAMLARPEQIDEITLRLVAEAALVSAQREDACTKLPEIVKSHNGVEWQKLMLVCQLRANDMKAAQLTLDLLHAQNVKDDIFFFVAEKNIMGSNKQLPRQLTPLKPLTLALLRLTDLPMPGEIYVHPDAALVPDLLAGKAREDVARIGLAERMAERGLLGSPELVAVYRSTVFPPEAIANAANSPESGPRLHALLYQAALQEKTVANRLIDAAKFMQSVSPALLNNVGGPALVDMIGDVPATPESNAVSGFVAHVYVLAGKNDTALEWVKLAKHAAVGMPSVAAELDSFWPQTVLAGLESESEYPADLNKWLDGFLKNADPKTDPRARHDQAASILLLLDGVGFTVPADAWVKVVDAAPNEKRALPSTLFFERLRASSTTPHHGETVMLSLALAGNGNELALLTEVEIVRALRLSGLTADAAMLAREAVSSILAPPKP